MRKVVLLFSAFIAVAPAAIAEPTRRDWTGFYAGVNAGLGFSRQESKIEVLQPTGLPYATGELPYSLNSDGPFAGLQIGAQYQLSAIVVGVEADLQFANISDNSLTSYAPPVIFPFRYDASARVSGFSTLRGRIGVAVGNGLFYFTGGVAFAEADYSATYLIPQNNAYARLRSDDRLRGYVLGGGVEYALDGNWSLKLEYQHLGFGSRTVEGALFFANNLPSGESVRTSFDTEIYTVRVGMNYRFGVPR